MRPATRQGDPARTRRRRATDTSGIRGRFRLTGPAKAVPPCRDTTRRRAALGAAAPRECPGCTRQIECAASKIAAFASVSSAPFATATRPPTAPPARPCSAPAAPRPRGSTPPTGPAARRRTCALFARPPTVTGNADVKIVHDVVVVPGVQRDRRHARLRRFRAPRRASGSDRTARPSPPTRSRSPRNSRQNA